MTSFELAVAVLASAVVGGLFVLIAQWAASWRANQRRMADVLDTVAPTVQRIERMTRALEGSETDVVRLKQALHDVSMSAEKLARTTQQVTTVATVLTPVIAAFVQRFTAAAEQRAKTSSEQSEPDSEDLAGGAEASAHTN